MKPLLHWSSADIFTRPKCFSIKSRHQRHVSKLRMCNGLCSRARVRNVDLVRQKWELRTFCSSNRVMKRRTGGRWQLLPLEKSGRASQTNTGPPVVWRMSNLQDFKFRKDKRPKRVYKYSKYRHGGSRCPVPNNWRMLAINAGQNEQFKFLWSLLSLLIFMVLIEDLFPALESSQP